MASYNHKRVFRAVSNELLKKFFERNGHDLKIDSAGTGKQHASGIFRQFIHLPEKERNHMENILHEIHEVASYDDNILTIRKLTHNIDLPNDFFEWKNYDIAMWIHLNCESIWDRAVRFAHADRLPKRSWTARIGLPKQRAGFSDENYESLKKGISAYLYQKEGRGQHCHIEYFERGSDLEYYFVYLNNFTGVSMHWKEEDDFELMPDRRSFEVVFVFDCKEGKLELNVLGDKDIKGTLHSIFAKVLFRMDIDLNPCEKPAYNIECLKERNFAFLIEPEDGINNASVQSLSISIAGCPGSRREYEEKNGNLYDAMEREINKENLPVNLRKVEKAKLHFTLQGCGRSNSQTVNISRNSCDVKNKPEKIRCKLEKCLKRSGLYAA